MVFMTHPFPNSFHRTEVNFKCVVRAGFKGKTGAREKAQETGEEQTVTVVRTYQRGTRKPTCVTLFVVLKGVGSFISLLLTLMNFYSVCCLLKSFLDSL